MFKLFKAAKQKLLSERTPLLPQANNIDYFATLPDELPLMVCDYLDRASLLSFRLSNKRLSAIAGDVAAYTYNNHTSCYNEAIYSIKILHQYHQQINGELCSRGMVGVGSLAIGSVTFLTSGCLTVPIVFPALLKLLLTGISLSAGGGIGLMSYHLGIKALEGYNILISDEQAAQVSNNMPTHALAIASRYRP
jgi:hypothetical protein